MNRLIPFFVLCWVLLPCWGVNSPSFAQPLSPDTAPADEAEAVPSAKKSYPFEKFGGVEYRSGEDFRLTLDAYVPEGPGPYPAILAVHGGAWRSGSKLLWFRHARKLAKAGFVVVAINYRKAPQFPFPAQLYDCKAAIRWMRKHAGDYKIDPEQIGAIGYSAGGHLVAMLAATDSGDGLEGEVPADEQNISTRIQAVAPGGAVCDFAWLDEQSTSLAYFLGASRAENPDVYRRASPITYVSPGDPPFYFFHGGNDWVVPEASPKAMHEMLEKQSVSSELVTYEGYGHMRLFSHLEAMDPVIDFFNKTLKRK
ncbi:MAG: alpha/beta hydrolase [Pirellulaceae bacterium]|nr:alpha/beta hydrolase [Pirellulaceae bacterium]